VELYPGIVAIRISIYLSAATVGCFSVLSNLQFRDFDINITKDRNGIALDKIICEFISKQWIPIFLNIKKFHEIN
jgi:hypothetical protein